MVVLALLLADVATAIVGNVPINAAIQSWRLDAIPESWRDVRGALLRYFRLRGALSLAAYAVLVYAVVCVWARTPMLP
jgi:hypothetical protein